MCILFYKLKNKKITNKTFFLGTYFVFGSPWDIYGFTLDFFPFDIYTFSVHC